MYLHKEPLISPLILRVAQSRVVHLALAATTVAALCPVLSAQPASFQRLGFLPDAEDPYPYSSASAISADGTTVVGDTRRGPSHEWVVFRWTAATGMTVLEHPPNLENPVATGVSADGAVVVGRTVFGYHGWRWTQATGMVELGMSGGYEYGYATGVSGDGDIIVGSAARVQGDCSCPSLCDPGSPLPETHWAGFHQDHPDGPLHGLDGIDQADSRASGISLDGSTIIGTSVVTDGCYSTTSVQACLWQTSQPIPLGVLPGDSWSNGISVSEDGAVAMGWSFGPGERTFRWTVSGMEDLGSIAGCTSPVGRAISADGSVVVGNCSCNGQYRAFIWNPEDGMRDLRAALVEFGLNLNGWLLIGANGISADGRTIAGSGINPSGQIEAWIAYLGDPLCPGDLDGDGSRSGADIQPFVNCYLSAGSGCAPADVDGNNVLDPGDLTTFLNMLLMSSPCP